MRPEVLLAQSTEYQPALFSSYVFPQKEQYWVVKGTMTKEWGHPDHFINEKGYRGKNFSDEKTPGQMRIIVYCGSAAYDINMPEGKDWPHRLESYLREDGWNGAEVINAGSPGNATYDCLGMLFAEGHHFKPDFVVLYESWNDIKRFASDQPLLREAKPYVSENNPLLYYQNPVDRFLGERSLFYVFLRQTLLAHHFKVTPEGAARRESKQYILNQKALDQFRLDVELFVDLAHNIGAEPILMTQGALFRTRDLSQDSWRLRYVESYLPFDYARAAMTKADEIIKDVARRKNVVLIDAA